MDVDAMLRAAEEGRIAVLYLLGPELMLRPDRDRVHRALANVPMVAVHAENWEDVLGDAHIVFPAAAYAEQDGSFINFGGRVQRIHKAFPPKGQAKPAGAVVRELTRRLGGTPPPETAAATFKLLVDTVPAFAGLQWASLAPHGAVSGVGIPAYATAEGWQ